MTDDKKDCERAPKHRKIVGDGAIHEIRLPHLPGFELEPALQGLHENWQTLEKLIVSFAEANSAAYDDLATMLYESKFVEATALTQRIKGMGSKVGAVSLANVAAEIETLLNDGETVIPQLLLEEFAFCASELLEAASVLTSMDESPKGISDKFQLENVEACLQSLKNHLYGDIGCVDDDVATLVALCRGSLLEGLALNIQQQFGEFNFTEITQSVNQYFSPDH